jgi:hypothetical protein
MVRLVHRTISLTKKAQATWTVGGSLPCAAVLLGPDEDIWRGAWETNDYCNNGRMTCPDRPLY